MAAAKASSQAVAKRRTRSRRALSGAVADEMLGCLRQLADDISARVARPSERSAADAERDVKLVALILKALEQLESLSPGDPSLETRDDDDSSSSGPGRAARDAELRAALERRFDELRAARDPHSLSGEPHGSGA